MEQPKFLTLMKTVQHGLLSRTYYAMDEEGRIWTLLEGFGDTKWKLYK